MSWNEDLYFKRKPMLNDVFTLFHFLCLIWQFSLLFFVIPVGCLALKKFMICIKTVHLRKKEMNLIGWVVDQVGYDEFECIR